MAQQSEFRRSKSWRESRVKTSHIPVRKHAADTDKIGRSRLTIKSLSNLDDLSEFVPYTDMFTDTFKETADATNNEQKTNEANKVVDVVNCFTDNIKGENADILKDNSQQYAPEVDDSGAAPNYLKAKKTPADNTRQQVRIK